MKKKPLANGKLAEVIGINENRLFLHMDEYQLHADEWPFDSHMGHEITSFYDVSPCTVERE